MMNKIWLRTLVIVLAAVGAGALGPDGPARAAVERVQPARPGAQLPSLTGLKGIQAGGEGESNLAPVTLEQLRGDRMALILYWIAGDPNSEEVLQQLAAWSDGRKDVTVIGVVPPRGKTAGEVAKRLSELGVDVPCIWDEGYKVQQTIQAATVPHITVVDKQGVIRLSGAYNLKHKVLGDITLQKYLETALSGGGSPTLTQIPRHYPVTELIDEPFLDFSLSTVPGGEEIRLSDLVKDGRYTLVVFWSADCGHCKIELPELNKYYNAHKEELDMVGVVKLPDAGIRQRTSDFIRVHNLEWPTVDDVGNKVFQEYRVRTTPTTVVVNPEGIIETVLLGSSVDLDAALGPLLEKVKKPQVATGT